MLQGLCQGNALGPRGTSGWLWASLEPDKCCGSLSFSWSCCYFFFLHGAAVWPALGLAQWGG